MPWKQWAFLEKVSSADFQSYLQNQVVAIFTSAAQRDTQMPTPAEGRLCYLLDAHVVQLYTGTEWIAISARGAGLGTLGFINRTTSTAAISATEADITGVTFVVQHVANRRILVEGYVPSTLSQAAGQGSCMLRVYAGATMLQEGRNTVVGTSTAGSIVARTVWVPAAGPTTYKLAGAAAGQSSVFNASATSPMHLLVRDIGPST